MNSMPSPPLALPTASRSPYQVPNHSDPAMDSLLSSVWHALEQSPPPSLREILDAYRSKGDGDRDMLIAMLNAKSAEDQRLASVASLQRTMLDFYQASLRPLPPPLVPLHIADAHRHVHSGLAYSNSAHFPSPPYDALQTHGLPREEAAQSSHRRADSSVSAVRDSQSPSDHSRPLASVHHTRKRRRVSPSPPRARGVPPRAEPPSQNDTLAVPSHDLPLPPSPYSTSSTHSSGGSPRSRESMAIGALLSSQGHLQREGLKRKVSSERSTSATSPRDHRDAFFG
ncbi:hypothetical protein B0H21DRAFT_737744 [Amylocystis lapponica]|nr:hypothetical protein B0H21DRAFT_737744 [Amylocystis lapponica]